MELYNEGLVDEEIGNSVGVSRRCIASWRQRNSLPANGNKRFRLNIHYATIDHLYEQGHTDKAIADEIGVERTAIARWRKKYGKPAKNPGGRKKEGAKK